MRRLPQAITLCLVLITMSLSADPVHDKEFKNKNKKGKKHKVEVGHRHVKDDDGDDDVIYYYETREEYEARRKYNRSRRTWTTECNERSANVERHIGQIIRSEARASNMSGPVSTTSYTTTCGPGTSVTITSRTLVGTQWYTFRAELQPTGKNPNSPEGWSGVNRVWEKRPLVVVNRNPDTPPTTQTPPTTSKPNPR